MPSSPYLKQGLTALLKLTRNPARKFGMNKLEAEAFALLREVFTTDEAVEEWLNSPNQETNSISPRADLLQLGGWDRVRASILRMIHGIPT